MRPNCDKLTQLHNADDLVAAMIRHALMDALGEDPQEASQARWWLDLAGMSHLLQRPEAAQFSPSARKRKPSLAAVAAQGA